MNLQAGSTGNVGVISGKYSTTKSGQSAYHVPIKIPPGTAGMNPSISLSYVGNQRNGILGIGFSLNGLLSIDRVGQTMAQDGKWTAVDYSPNDRFTLAGERLIAINGEYGAPGTEYRTERESWTRIVSFGNINGGPESFVVTTRNGRTMLFGADVSSRVPAGPGKAIRTWGINRVTDLNGNYYAVSYALDLANNCHRPLIIEYTGNDSSSPVLVASRRIQFSYEDRIDPVRDFCGGYASSQMQRLRTVATYVGESLVKTYTFSYKETAITGRSELETITEADGSGIALPPISLIRPAETTNWLSQPVLLPYISNGAIPSNSQSVTGDLSGNGMTDLVFFWPVGNNSTMNYAVFMAKEDGSFENPVFGTTQCSLGGGQTGPVPVDVNGNGQTDFILLYENSNELVYSILVWEGNNFSVSAPVPIQLNQLPPGLVPQIVPVDLNGEGKTDLFIPFQNSSGQFSYYILKSTGAGYSKFGVARSLEIPMDSNYSSMLLAANISGSPIQEIVYGYSGFTSTDIYTLTFNGSVFEFNEPLRLSLGLGDYNYLIPISAIGQGLTDFAFVWQNPGNKNTYLKVLCSNGVGVIDPGINPTVEIGNTYTGISPVNLTGNGRTDLLMYSLDANGKLIVTPYLANNANFVSQPAINTEMEVNSWSCLTPDLLGVGRNDLVIANLDGTNQDAQGFCVFKAALTNLGLVEKITNGIGGTTTIEYLPVTDKRVYSESQLTTTESKNLVGFSTARSCMPFFLGGSSSGMITGPLRHVIEVPLQLVWKTTVEDGLGHSYTKSRFYTDGLVSLGGRGWLGYKKTTITDNDTLTMVNTVYCQDFPLSGMVSSESTGSVDSGKVLRIRNFTYDIETPTNSSVFVIQVKKRETSIISVLSGNSFTHYSEYQYDNFGNRISTKYYGNGNAAEADLYITKVYENDSQDWCLGLLTSSIAFSDALGQTVLKRQSYTYDTVTKQLLTSSQWNSTRPDDSPVCNYSYDSFGNKIAIQVNNGAATFYQFDVETDFTYPGTRIRKASETKILKDSFTYDMRFGVWTSHTDPNGNTRSRSFDDLGRVSTVSIPGPNGLFAVKKIERQFDTGIGYTRITTQYQSWDSNIRKVTRDYLDGYRRKYRTVLQGQGLSETGERIIDIQLDSSSRELGRTFPYKPNGPILWSKAVFDPLGRVVSRIFPISEKENVVTQISYDGINRTSILGYGTLFSGTTIEHNKFFNGRLRVVQRTDANGQVSTFQYDPLGRIIVATPPAATDQSVEYNSLDKPQQLSGAEFGTVKVDSIFKERKIEITYANQQKVTVECDILNRPFDILFSDGTHYSISYDEASGNGMGRLAGVSAFANGSTPLYSWSQQYNERGNATQLSLLFDGNSYVHQRNYYPSGLILEQLFHDKSAAGYTYDGLGQIRKLTYTPLNGQEQTIATYDDYTVFGRPQISTTGNGLQRIWQYDERGKMMSHQVLQQGSGGRSLLSRSFEWDILGRLYKVTDLNSGNVSDQFMYDKAGQINTWKDQAGVTHDLDFDPAGNILSTGSTSLIYNGSNKIDVTPQQGEQYSLLFDASGNRIKRANTEGPDIEYTYDSANRLVSTGALGFVYDHRGRRIFKKDNAGNKTIYLTSNDLISTSVSGRQGVKLICDPFGVIAVIETNDSNNQFTYFLEQDQVKSTILVTGIGGDLIAMPKYEPFGKLLNPIPGVSAYIPGFGGQQFDQESGLAYFRARYYDPSIGRFISADSRLGGGLTTTNSFNRFAYALNNPINITDKNGHDWWDWLVSGLLELIEIVAGAVLDYFGVESLGTALIGAGVAGLSYEATAAITGQDFSWKAWGVSEAIGAVVGLTMGAAAEAIAAEGPLDAAGGAPGGGGGDVEMDELAPLNRGGNEVMEDSDLMDGSTEENGGGNNNNAPANNAILMENMQYLPPEVQEQIGENMTFGQLNNNFDELPEAALRGGVRALQRGLQIPGLDDMLANISRVADDFNNFGNPDDEEL